MKIVTIRQSRSYDIDIDVDKHVKLTNEYFKNLNTINLKLVKPVSVDELSKILLVNQKIKYLSLEGDLKDDFEYSVKSDLANILLYTKEDKQIVSIKNFKLYSISRHCRVQGDYVIFDNDYSRLEFDFQRIEMDCQDYDSLDLQSIDQQAFVIHKKYIHTLFIYK